MPESWWIEDLDHRAYESEIESLDDEFGTPHLSTVEAAYIRANAATFLA